MRAFLLLICLGFSLSVQAASERWRWTVDGGIYEIWQSPEGIHYSGRNNGFRIERRPCMARVIDDFVAQLSNKIKAEKPAGKWPKDYAPISLWAADDQKPILVLHGSDLGLFLLGMHGHFQEMTMLERRLCK